MMSQQYLKCPVCGDDTLIEGEKVDVGLGTINGVKCGPDTCEICGYIEQGPDPSDLPIEHYKRCWEEKIDPRPQMPKMEKASLAEKYAQWIKENVKTDKQYGRCREVCADMVQEFPELRRVYGTYFCWIWGPRNHFWCITPNNEIVDPTVGQFPSQGVGPYSGDRFYPLEFDKLETQNERM